MEEHKCGPPPTKGLPLQNYIEKDGFLQYEVRDHHIYNHHIESQLNDLHVSSIQLLRYKTYVNVLSNRMAADEQNEYQNAMADDPMMAQGYQQLTVSLTGGMGTTTTLAAPQLTLQQQAQSNRYGNRSNIYRAEQQQDIG